MESKVAEKQEWRAEERKRDALMEVCNMCRRTPVLVS